LCCEEQARDSIELYIQSYVIVIQWTLESQTQSVPRGGSSFNLFDFRDKWHEPHVAVQCRSHGLTFEFLFEFQTEFFSNFLFEFQVVQESNCLTFEGPLYVLILFDEVLIPFMFR
jgi:hypothetical protein